VLFLPRFRFWFLVLPGAFSFDLVSKIDIYLTYSTYPIYFIYLIYLINTI